MNAIEQSIDLIQACWRFLWLGVIQGLTEFIPISSTAHIKVVPMLLGWDDPGIATTGALHLGSIFAILNYFKNDISSTIKSIINSVSKGDWSNKDSRLGLAIMLGTIPILVVGFIIRNFWEIL